MRWLGCGEQQVRVFDHRVPGGPQPEQVGVDLGLRLAGVVGCKPAPLHAQEKPSCRPGTERPCKFKIHERHLNDPITVTIKVTGGLENCVEGALSTRCW